VLLACFFVLGMGLLAPISAILQCLDSLNAQYEVGWWEVHHWAGTSQTQQQQQQQQQLWQSNTAALNPAAGSKLRVHTR
jgi:alkylated DNA nucleotide flippase Atl1